MPEPFLTNARISWGLAFKIWFGWAYGYYCMKRIPSLIKQIFLLEIDCWAKSSFFPCCSSGCVNILQNFLLEFGNFGGLLISWRICRTFSQVFCIHLTAFTISLQFSEPKTTILIVSGSHTPGWHIGSSCIAHKILFTIPIHPLLHLRWCLKAAAFHVGC